MTPHEHASFVVPVRSTFAFTLIIALASTVAQAQSSVLNYSSSPAQKERRVTLRRQNDRVVIVDDDTHAVVASSPSNDTRRVVVNGLEGDHRDTLTVDLRGGLGLADGIDFNAGVAGFDTLNIIHDPAREVRFDYQTDDARGHRGRVVVDGTVINYSGIEPLTNTGTAADIVVTLPAGTVGASLQDDGTLGNNTVQIASTNGTFEMTNFTVPTNSLTINGGGGTDTITTSANFSGDFNAALTINGTAATDSINLGALTLGNAGANTGNVTVSGNIITVSGAVNTTAGTSGQVSLTARRNMTVSGTGGLATTGGAITLSANQGAQAAGRFFGVNVIGTITSATGAIQIHGRGGDTNTNNYGVIVDGGATISSTGTGPGASTIEIIGTGGPAATSINVGILLSDGPTRIRTIDGAITLTGTGGGGVSANDNGLYMQFGVQVLSTGNGSITMEGIGTSSSTGFVMVLQSGGPSTVASSSAPIEIQGTPGPLGGFSMDLGQAGTTGTIQSTATANITLTGDSMNIDPSAIIDGGTNIVTLQPQSAGTVINLGGADSPAVLGLTSAELSRITAGILRIGDQTTDTGGITVSAAITAPATWSTLELRNEGPFSGSGGSFTATNLRFFDGSATGHTWTMSPASVTEDANAAIPYSGAANVMVTGGTGSDTFDVTPSSTTAMTIDGNLPTTAPGDVLDVSLAGTTNPTDTGTAFTFADRATVSFSNIESVNPTDVMISKIAPATATAGNDITYGITVTNAGPDDAAGLTLFDALPAGTTFVSLSIPPGWSCGTVPAAGTNGPVSCTTPALLNGATSSFSLVVNVGSSAGSGATISNTATVTIANTDTNAVNNSSTASTTIGTSADLSVTKSGPASVNPGSNATYMVTLTNNGASDAQSVSLTDATPAGTTFVSITQTSGPAFTSSPPAVGGSGTITESIATLPTGASATFQIVLNANSNITAAYTNIANVSSSTADANSANNTASATTTPNVADLAATKSGPATATAGTNVTYTLTVTNNGPADASIASLADALPAGTTFVSEAQNSGPAFTCTNPAVGANGTVSCSIATLVNGQTASFTIVAKVASSVANGSTLSNTATASSTTTDNTSGNNSATVTTSVSASADLSVTKSGPASVTAGSNLTYSITATNNGASDAQSVVVSDTLPAGSTFVSLTQTSGPAFTLNPLPVGGSGTVTATIGTFANAQSATFQLIVKSGSGLSSGTTVTNTVAISTSTTDPNGANNSSTATTTVNTQADLSVTKSGPATANPGTDVIYTIVVANGGPSDAAPANLTDALPAGTTFVSESQTTGPAFNCTNPPVGATGTVTCTIGTLVSGASATFSIVLHTNTANFSNVAVVSSSTNDPNPLNNNATATTGINTADVSVTKSAAAPIPFGGQNITYTIVVSNAGPATATSVNMTDVLPAGSTFVSATPSSACSGTTTITCSVPTLNSGASTTFTLIILTPDAGGPITNTATVSASQFDSNLSNNSATATIVLQPASAIPTLSTTILLLLAAMLALIAALRLR